MGKWSPAFAMFKEGLKKTALKGAILNIDNVDGDEDDDGGEGEGSAAMAKRRQRKEKREQAKAKKEQDEIDRQAMTQMADSIQKVAVDIHNDSVAFGSYVKSIEQKDDPEFRSRKIPRLARSRYAEAARCDTLRGWVDATVHVDSAANVFGLLKSYGVNQMTDLSEMDEPGVAEALTGVKGLVRKKIWNAILVCQATR
jgi:hypothetical protein